MRRERTLNAAASSPHVPGVWPRASSGPARWAQTPISQGRAGGTGEISIKRNITFLLVFWNDESGYRPSIEGLRDFWNAGCYNRITPPPSRPACLCSRLMHGSTRSHRAREPVGPGVRLSASSPEAARPSPQEAPPPPSAPRAPPGHMALRVRVRVCVCVVAGLVQCAPAYLCVYYVRTDASFCSIYFKLSHISILLFIIYYCDYIAINISSLFLLEVIFTN